MKILSNSAVVKDLYVNLPWPSVATNDLPDSDGPPCCHFVFVFEIFSTLGEVNLEDVCKIACRQCVETV